MPLARKDLAPAAYLGAFAIFATLNLAVSPIVAYDNDLWTHLEHGRTIAATGGLPATSYFSFAPERTWVNYHWLFRVGIWGLYSLAGYPGLLLLRAALFAGVAALVVAILASRRADGASWTFVAVAGTLALAVLQLPFFLVRPHAVSFLAIAAFLYVLEVRPAWIPALPPLAVLWMNLHGVEYPVMLAILGAYLGAPILRALAARDGPASIDVRRSGWLALAMVACLATPHGLALLRLPFENLTIAAPVIREMHPLRFEGVFELHATSAGFQGATARNLFLWLVVATAGFAVARAPRLEPLLLLGAGLFLLTRAERFAAECVLLSLPLLRDGGTGSWQAPRRRALTLLALPLLLVPFASLHQQLATRSRTYPVSTRFLPDGVASFLARQDAGGNLLCSSLDAGYFVWALPDRYRIYADMEVFPFTDEEVAFVNGAFRHPEVLRTFLARYAPPFIAAPADVPSFAGLVAEHPQYVPILFDDVTVLYVDRERHPALAAELELREVDPFTLLAGKLAVPPPERIDAWLDELERVRRNTPGAGAVNQAIALLLNAEGDYARALTFADDAIASDPGLWIGHRIKASSLHALGRCVDAVPHYRAAARSADEAARRTILRGLGLCQLELGEPRRAWRTLSEAIDVWATATPWQDVYQLGELAFEVGEVELGRKYLRLAATRVPAAEVEARRRIEDRLAAPP